MTHDNAQNDARARFRNAMASLGAAVNVITTDGPRGRNGITASAVCSVTDSPPTMLVCINQSSYVHDVLHENANVCINVLGAHGEALAQLFAGMTGCSMQARFDQCAWTPGHSGVPVLDDAISSLQGKIVDSKPVGSHSVIFVQIDRIASREEGDGLVYFGRQFHHLPRAGASRKAA